MRRLTTLMAVLAALLFVSCDEDVDTAIRLEGEWTGDFGMYTVYQTYDRYGRPIEIYYDADYSNMRFYWDGGSRGHGEQIDFYRNGPYRWQSYYFQWRVDRGILYLFYNYDHQLDCAIYDYYMDYNYFTGRINNADGGYTNFKLFKLADFNSWGRYNPDYYYGFEYYPGYYVKSRGGQDAPVSADTSALEVVRHGSRYMDGK